ncbi:MAG TPA: hypothetical protein ENI53_01540 [Thermoplasmatales archaeon]|nr:hypothetical protein [Thermoplasmatales archaeon]
MTKLPKVKVRINKQKVESYLKIILMGMLTAIAIFVGQWLLYNTFQLLVATILCVIIFVIASGLYLLKREGKGDIPKLVKLKNW